MLNRFRLPPLSGNVRRLQSGIGYNNGKSYIFLCKKYNFKAARQETLPSLILAKSRGGGYTKAILRGARNRREPTNNDAEGGSLPGNRRIEPCFRESHWSTEGLCLKVCWSVFVWSIRK